jgi:XRE family transcriptional regulator, regulator of sulfur utilization
MPSPAQQAGSPKNDCRMSIGLVVCRSIAVALGVGAGGMAMAQVPPTLATMSPPSDTAPLRTTFVEWNALPVRPIPQGFLRPVFDNPATGLEKIEVHVTTLKPGMTLHAPHHHSWEEMCLVREGEVQVSFNGRKERAAAGSLVFFASHDAHSIENASDQPATYFVINICSPLARSLPDSPLDEPNSTGKLPSTVFDCNSVPQAPNETGSIAKIFDSPTRTFAQLASEITTLNAGQSTTGGTAAAESALCFIQAGRLDVAINGISCRTGEGSFFYCGPREQRTLKNIGSTPAVYQLIRIVPAPAKPE